MGKWYKDLYTLNPAYHQSLNTLYKRNWLMRTGGQESQK